jgi:hypothetical protein
MMKGETPLFFHKRGKEIKWLIDLITCIKNLTISESAVLNRKK